MLHSCFGLWKATPDQPPRRVLPDQISSQLDRALGIHYNTTNDLLDYLKDPAVFAYSEGYVAIPQGPGLGIEIDEEVVERMSRTGHRWRNPVWRHPDGSFAEW